MADSYLSAQIRPLSGRYVHQRASRASLAPIGYAPAVRPTEDRHDLRELRRREPRRQQVLRQLRQPARGHLPALRRAEPERRAILRHLRPDAGHLDTATAEQTPTTPASAERRLVTVLFTDLVGFTSLAEDRDPEAVRELLSKYFETATEIVKLHGGTVEKFIGDAVMAVWGTPTAHEDDAERAVRAALELVDAVGTLHPNLQARAGLLTGQAAVTLGATNQGMVAGDLVNTAARLQGVADPGTVLVGDATRRAAESAIVFEPIGDHSLKGKTSPVPAWQALRVVAQRGGHGRTDTLEAPFVGRDEELRQLKEQLHAVGRDRRARLVSITGPGGIGKSRLVWELEKYIDGVSEAIYWHRGRSPSYGEGITFWALGEMVRRRAQLTEDDDEATTRERIAVTLDEYVEDADERERIGPALLSLLGVEEAPAGGRDTLFPAWRLFFERIAELGTTVLVFEDLQWADTGLLDFIDHLLDWSKGLPIMVVSLARPELFDRRPDWGASRRNLTALALEPLTDDAMRELLNGLVPGLPEEALAAIIGRAEGVPLYAVETVRGLLADGRIQRNGDLYEPIGDLTNITVPDSLRSLIASRLDALEPADRTLLQDASVLGQVFSADALTAITGATDDLEPRLRALVRRELLEIEADPRSPERGQYRFVQSLDPGGGLRNARAPRPSLAPPGRGAPLRGHRRRRDGGRAGQPLPRGSRGLRRGRRGRCRLRASSPGAHRRCRPSGSPGRLRPGGRLPRPGTRHHDRSG